VGVFKIQLAHQFVVLFVKSAAGNKNAYGHMVLLAVNVTLEGLAAPYYLNWLCVTTDPAVR
jgi:hypothetical protein